ncbi:hypothetical protein CIPAW_11G089100 [Carya illinoinensis]|uniref:Uncharacterized protein n=1 Tax=Carya illinoinensis TaxID=32201 RepID=A0A8T1P5E6_CARIL|nr:hypothetical protein CIPAW_11G089100 [Carya illinoinensis]
MSSLLDLRYLVPPFISLCFMILLPQDKPWPQGHGNLAFDILYHHPFFLAIFILLFLLISVKLPITAGPIYLQVGDFSISLTVSILASLIFPASLFWLIFPILTIASPWYHMLLDGFKHCIYWFYKSLQQIPTLIVHYTIQRQEETEAAPLQAEIELIEIIQADV